MALVIETTNRTRKGEGAIMSTRQDKTHYAHNDLEQMNAYVESTAFKDRVRKHEEEEAARKAELLNHVREAEETKWRRGFMST